MREAEEAGQDELAILIFRLFGEDGLVLLDGLGEHLFIDAAGLGIANEAGVDAAQHAACIEIFGIEAEQFFGFGDGAVELAGLDVEIGQFLGEEGGGGVLLEGELVELDGLVEIIAAIAVGTGHFGIEVAHGEVVVGGALIANGGLGFSGLALSLGVEGGKARGGHSGE